MGLVWKINCVGHEALYFPIQAHRLINPQWPELGFVGAAVTAIVMQEDYNTKLLGKRMHDIDIYTRSTDLDQRWFVPRSGIGRTTFVQVGSPIFLYIFF